MDDDIAIGRGKRGGGELYLKSPIEEHRPREGGVGKLTGIVRREAFIMSYRYFSYGEGWSEGERRGINPASVWHDLRGRPCLRGETLYHPSYACGAREWRADLLVNSIFARERERFNLHTYQNKNN